MKKLTKRQRFFLALFSELSEADQKEVLRIIDALRLLSR